MNRTIFLRTGEVRRLLGIRGQVNMPRGLMNEVKSLLKREGRITKREEKLKRPEGFLFHPPARRHRHYSENRIRQIFQSYVRKAGLDREYGTDSRGRKLHQFTLHSLRHAHVMHFIHVHKLPLPIVQKQVGHTTLKGASAYLKPSHKTVAEGYESAQLIGSRVLRGAPVYGYACGIGLSGLY